jgi:hypothetical protein
MKDESHDSTFIPHPSAFCLFVYELKHTGSAAIPHVPEVMDRSWSGHIMARVANPQTMLRFGKPGYRFTATADPSHRAGRRR